MSFKKTYGEIGKNFIHVHHIKPLAGVAGEYKLDPFKDLVPVCPNCHAMLHTYNPPLSVQELKNILNENRGN
jgi:5-methylcytosine-specific restriction protein A